MTDATASDQTLLTIAELARNLELPESTTRYYCNRFAEHLSSVGEGRRRRYLPEAQDTLRTIAETMRRNKNAFAVDLVLRDRHQNDATSSLPSIGGTGAGSSLLIEQMLRLMGNQTKALQDIANGIAIFAERLPLPAQVNASAALDKSAPLPDGASPPSSETETALRAEIASLREQMRTAESVHQNDLEQLRKWLTRLGSALSAK